MARSKDKYGSRRETRKLRASLIAMKLKRERLAYGEQRRRRVAAMDEALDYLDADLITARETLRQHRIEAEIKRIYREITGYVRNGGEAPNAAQREAAREADEERRGWAMIDDLLRKAGV